MIVESDTRSGLQDCDEEAWQHVIGHAKHLVAQHLERAETGAA
jgi:hypothetical protein